MHRSWPGVRFGAGAYEAAVLPIAGCCRRLSSAFLSSFVAADIRLFIFPVIAFVVSFIELMSSTAFVFSFIELMFRPLENRPRKEFPLAPTESDCGTFLVPALSCSARSDNSTRQKKHREPCTKMLARSRKAFQEWSPMLVSTSLYKPTSGTCSEPAPPAPNCMCLRRNIGFVTTPLALGLFSP